MTHTLEKNLSLRNESMGLHAFACLCVDCFILLPSSQDLLMYKHTEADTIKPHDTLEHEI